MLFVTAEIKQYGDAQFMGWTHEFKALVVQGESIDEVKKELFISIRAKVAHDMKLSIKNVEASEVTAERIESHFKHIVDHQYHVQLA